MKRTQKQLNPPKGIPTILAMLVSLPLLFALSGCENLSTKPVDATHIEINLQNQTNAEATLSLAKQLENNGFTVKPVSDDQLVLRYNQHNYILEPKLHPKGLSRIVVSRLFEIKPEYQSSPNLFVLVTALNRDLNFAKFSILPENHAGHVQTAITFVDEKVSLDEIKQFIAWFDDSLAEVKQMVPPEALDMIQTPNSQ
ncbi:MAG: YbjN domain-containing protein [Hydrogenovibrio sp.]